MSILLGERVLRQASLVEGWGISEQLAVRRGDGVVIGRTEWRKKRRLRLRGVLTDHSHGGHGRGERGVVVGKGQAARCERAKAGYMAFLSEGRMRQGRAGRAKTKLSRAA